MKNSVHIIAIISLTILGLTALIIGGAIRLKSASTQIEIEAKPDSINAE